MHSPNGWHENDGMDSLKEKLEVNSEPLGDWKTLSYLGLQTLEDEYPDTLSRRIMELSEYEKVLAPHQK